MIGTVSPCNSMDNSKKDPLIPHYNGINCVFQRRYVVAGLCFLCTFMLHSLRLNISIAMVAMVNTTLLDDIKMAVNGTTMCPAELYNSTDATPQRGEFSWSPELQGYILSSGFIGMFVMQIPGGIISGRYGAKIAIVNGLLISAACNLLSPLAARQHPYMLYALTLIRGLAQGLHVPAISVLMAAWFPKRERLFLSSIATCGLSMGPVVTGVVGGLLCDSEFLGGWPLIFYVFGLGAALVGILFIVFYYDKPEDDPRISQEELKYLQNVRDETACIARPPTPWLAMFTSPSTYSYIVGLFGFHWLNNYLLSVHTLYLGTVLNLPIKQNGALSGWPFVVSMICSWFITYFTFWIKKNNKITINAARKGFNSVGTIAFCIGLIGIYLAKCDITLNTIFLNIATGSVGFTYMGSMIAGLDMSPTFCGPLVGAANTVASISGFLVPIIVGNITNEGQNLTEWGKIFFISIGVSFVCGMIFQFFASVKVQPWDPLFEKIDSESKKENETELSESTAIYHKV